MRLLRRGIAPTLCLLLATSCGVGGEISVDELRGEVLERIASDVILPNLRRMDATGQALANEIAALALAPSEAGVLAAQEAWRAARAAWNRAEAVIVGPPDDLLLPSQVDTSPVDVARLEMLIAGITPIDPGQVALLGSTQKGFHALEHLLFDVSGDSQPVLDALTLGVDAPRRLALLSALAVNLAQTLAQIRDLWEPSGGNFAAEFTSAGAGSSVFPTRKDALDVLLNHSIALVEVLADQRLGRPLGRSSGGLPQPPGAECSLSGNSRLDVLGDALGLRDLYTGRPDGSRGSGLTALVAIAHSDIDAVLLDGFRGLVDAIDAIAETLLESAQTDPASVEAAFQAAKALKAMLVADLAGALGGTLTFSPNDGD